MARAPGRRRRHLLAGLPDRRQPQVRQRPGRLVRRAEGRDPALRHADPPAGRRGRPGGQGADRPRRRGGGRLRAGGRRRERVPGRRRSASGCRSTRSRASRSPRRWSGPTRRPAHGPRRRGPAGGDVAARRAAAGGVLGGLRRLRLRAPWAQDFRTILEITRQLYGDASTTAAAVHWTGLRPMTPRPRCRSSAPRATATCCSTSATAMSAGRCAAARASSSPTPWRAAQDRDRRDGTARRLMRLAAETLGGHSLTSVGNPVNVEGDFRLYIRWLPAFGARVPGARRQAWLAQRWSQAGTSRQRSRNTVSAAFSGEPGLKIWKISVTGWSS